jgi:branched-chain amino acid transport system permease protein
MADADATTTVNASALASAMAEPLHARPSTMRIVFYAVMAVFVLVFPHVFEASNPHYVHVMINIFMFALMAQSWNILAGFCGQISLGHAAFFGIGAYSTGYLFFAYQISPWIGMLIGILIAMAMAVAIGIPTFRLRGHYFAIATLLIGVGVQIFFQRWEQVGAASGIFLPIVREQPLLSFQFHGTKLPYYYIILAFLALACLIVRRLDRSRIGFYFRAIRDEPEAASSLGVNVTLYKSFAFMISAALMSMAGAFYCQYVLVIDPDGGHGRRRNAVGPGHRCRRAGAALGGDARLLRWHRRHARSHDLRRPHRAHLYFQTRGAGGCRQDAPHGCQRGEARRWRCSKLKA